MTISTAPTFPERSPCIRVRFDRSLKPMEWQVHRPLSRPWNSHPATLPGFGLRSRTWSVWQQALLLPISSWFPHRSNPTSSRLYVRDPAPPCRLLCLIRLATTLSVSPPPNPTPVKRNQWSYDTGITGPYDAFRVRFASNGGYDLFVNEDCTWLITELSNRNNDADQVKHWFTWGLALAGSWDDWQHDRQAPVSPKPRSGTCRRRRSRPGRSGKGMRRARSRNYTDVPRAP